MYHLTKLESNHLRNKSIGKHKLKINLGSLAGRWETIRKWLVGTVALLAIFSLGIMIGKYYFSPRTGLPKQPSDLIVESQLTPQIGPIARDHSAGTTKASDQAPSPTPPSETTAMVGVGKAEKPQTALPNVESTAKPITSSVPSTVPPTVESSAASVPPKPAPSPKNTASAAPAEGVQKLLQKCENLFKKNRLVSAKGKQETALDCYQQILGQEPQNTKAKTGLKRLEDHYRNLLETALKKGQIKEGRRYLADLQKINPKSTVLPSAEQRLNELASATQENPEVTALLKQCAEHFKAGRFLAGKGGTALECYNQVLAKVPNHQEAKAGLKKIETRYQQLAEKFLKQGQLSKARGAIQNLQRVNPNSSRLTELQQRLAELERKANASSPPSSPPQPPVRPLSKPSAAPTPVVTPPPPAPLPRPSKPPPSQESPVATEPQTPPPPALTPPRPRQPPRCSEIFIQESLGIQPLTTEARDFKRKFCN